MSGSSFAVSVNRARHTLAAALALGTGPAATDLPLAVAEELHGPSVRAPEVATGAVGPHARRPRVRG